MASGSLTVHDGNRQGWRGSPAGLCEQPDPEQTLRCELMQGPDAQRSKSHLPKMQDEPVEKSLTRSTAYTVNQPPSVHH